VGRKAETIIRLCRRKKALTVPVLMQMLCSEAGLISNRLSLCRRQIGVSRFLQESGKAKAKSKKSSESCLNLEFLMRREAHRETLTKSREAGKAPAVSASLVTLRNSEGERAVNDP
jgi:hypothetical protein